MRKGRLFSDFRLERSKMRFFFYIRFLVKLIRDKGIIFKVNFLNIGRSYWEVFL